MELGESFLLRVEGVNLDAVIEDTQDLSTSRGGSLLLLNVIAAVEESLRQEHSSDRLTAAPELLSRGASIGVFRVELAAVADAVVLRRDVEGWLAGRSLPVRISARSRNILQLARHATFVVDMVSTAAAFPTAIRPAALEAVLAANRLRRMQALNLVYPDPETLAAVPAEVGRIEERICGESLAAPALVRQRLFKGGLRWVGRSIWERRVYGQRQKSDFYREVLESASRLPAGSPSRFAQDLAEITTFTEAERDAHKAMPADEARRLRRLEGKMAVLYADGNRFTTHQQSFIERHGAAGKSWQAGLCMWDNQLRRWRADLLAVLLERLNRCGALATRPLPHGRGSALRLETLLWGGDEFLMIVPAWLGLQLAGWFHNEVRPRTAGWEVDGQGLHHASGLVFCHHDAPIHRIAALAKELARGAKRDRTVSRLSYEVLESFDFLGGSVTEVRRQRFKAMPPEAWVLDPGMLARLPRGLTGLRAIGLTRRQLRRIAAESAIDEQGDRYATTQNALVDELAGGMPALERVLADIDPEEDRRRWVWVHLETLHDYLPTEPP
jgi:hypothetical protein